MTVDNKTLQTFFNSQKKPRIDALLSLNISKKTDLDKNNKKAIPKRYQTDTKLIP